jgi:hypothetical protein
MFSFVNVCARILTTLSAFIRRQNCLIVDIHIDVLLRRGVIAIKCEGGTL